MISDVTRQDGRLLGIDYKFVNLVDRSAHPRPELAIESYRIEAIGLELTNFNKRFKLYIPFTKKGNQNGNC